MMDTLFKYDSAYKELNSIAGEVESGKVSVDVLADKVKRASFLIEFCQAKLKGTRRMLIGLLRGWRGRGNDEND